MNDGRIETRNDQGKGLVSAAAGCDFRTAMIDAVVRGLEKDKPGD